MRPILWIIILTGWTAECQAAEAPTKPDRSPEAISKWISRLDDEKFVVREEATRELVKIGTPALRSLQKVLFDRPNPEVRMRSQYILDRCSGGETIAGLKIALTSDKQQLAPGGKLTLTITLSNQTKRPITLYVGYGSEGANFTSGAALRLLAADPNKQDRVKVVLPRWRTAALVAATERPMLITLPAGENKKYRLKVTLSSKSDKADSANWMLGEGALMSLAAPHSEIVRLKIAHTVTAQMNRAALGRKKQSGQPALWSGAVHSNEVKIRVSEK